MVHTIIHFEIPADNVEKIRKFYVDLFGWKITKLPGDMEYYTIETVPMNEKGNLQGPGVNGGLYKKEQPQQHPLNYIYVESVVEYSKKVAALGGQNNYAENRDSKNGLVRISQRPRRKRVWNL